MPPAPTLVLLPGLGADARVFDAMRPLLPTIHTPPWLTPRDNESLADYAARLADTIPAVPGPLVLGGSSMGGMLALEIARLRPPAVVVLIASCRRMPTLQPAVRAIGRLLDVLPTAAYRLGRAAAPLLVGKFGEIPLPRRQLYLRMVSSMPPAFLRWGSRAVSGWPGLPDVNRPPATVRHIHGSADRMIPLSAQSPPPDRVIPGAGHLITLSHPEVVAAFVSDAIAAAARCG
ncbi:MAG: hypothetical protein BIFFINMI_01757 [Phycisphaerae bacterium]|nr:hypothetical protein [Phycisphaerae bacterium]